MSSSELNRGLRIDALIHNVQASADELVKLQHDDPLIFTSAQSNQLVCAASDLTHALRNWGAEFSESE